MDYHTSTSRSTLSSEIDDRNNEKDDHDPNDFTKYYSSSLSYKNMEINEKEKINNSLNKMSLIELLYGFFEFYSNFDYNKYQISLHSKSLIQKKYHQFAKIYWPLS